MRMAGAGGDLISNIIRHQIAILAVIILGDHLDGGSIFVAGRHKCVRKNMGLNLFIKLLNIVGQLGATAGTGEEKNGLRMQAKSGFERMCERLQVMTRRGQGSYAAEQLQAPPFISGGGLNKPARACKMVMAAEDDDGKLLRWVKLIDGILQLAAEESETVKQAAFVIYDIDDCDGMVGSSQKVNFRTAGIDDVRF